MNSPNFSSNPDLNSISVLIPKCKDGNDAAREQLLKELQGFLTQVANKNLDSKLKKKLGISDIVQTSLIRVVKHFEQFRGSTSIELHAWIKQIVINEIHKTRRSYATEKRDVSREQLDEAETALEIENQIFDNQATPTSQALANERIETFYKVLDQLSDEHAMVIRLRSVDRLSFKEIGQQMDRSEDAVSKLWFRAMLKFEEKLKGNKNFVS